MRNEMEAKKKSILVKFLIGIMVLIFAIAVPFIYIISLRQNWGCGYYIFNDDALKIYIPVYIAAVYAAIIYIVRPSFIGSMSILAIISFLAVLIVSDIIRNTSLGKRHGCEMRWNFASLYDAEQKYFDKNGVYAPSLAELKWRPMKIERYCFFLSEAESAIPKNIKDCALPKGVTPFVSKNTFLIVAVGRMSRDNYDVWTIDEKKELKNLRDDVKL